MPESGGGLGLGLTTLFIAGQMAGGGVLMLPGKGRVHLIHICNLMDQSINLHLTYPHSL